MSDVCVVHLVWAPLGSEPLERFLRSYERHPAGLDHRLLMAFNGFRSSEELDRFESLLAGFRHESFDVGRGLDLAAYKSVAEQVEARYFYFLNSYCVLLDEGWLAKPFRYLHEPGIGIVGATGSHESFYSATRWPFRIIRRHSFPPFPNPHIRTSAFAISRDVMRGLRWGTVRTKSAAWRLESGKKNVTRQLKEKGLDALVVGRDGRAYTSEQWYHSQTFRSDGQSNLLVADNRTMQFEQADAKTRRMLSQRAWGGDR